MPSTIQHPAFGELVPDKWGDSLFTVRAFPYMKSLFEPLDTAEGLSDEQRQWVEQPLDHLEELSAHGRDANVYAALRAQGVFEVYVPVGATAKGVRQVSKEQVAAYEYLTQHEEAVCKNVISVLHRFYRFAQQSMPDYFEHEDYPRDPNDSQLGEICGFDCLTFVRSSASGLSALQMAFRPEWDLEHGLQMAVLRDQVLAVSSDGIDELLSEPEYYEADYGWGPEQMTAEETAALQEFKDHFDPGDRDL